MSTTFLSKKGFKELQKEISGLEISEKALTLELKEIGRAKSRDDKLRRNDVITQLENIQSKIFTKKDILRHAKPLPRKRDRLKIAIGSVVDLVDQQGKFSAIRWFTAWKRTLWTGEFPWIARWEKVY
ncbi:hypothetical protein MBN60_01375 [Candidatus Saccharibacteria bacterium]|nr:hypothetical protein [Candidatus Saccharibacteria bacterium]